MRIFLLGMMGSGKSHWGKILSQHFAIPYYDLDHEIEAFEGRTIAQIFEQDSESFFRNRETEILKSFSKKENFVLALGGGTPCFNENMEWIVENGESIWINESAETLRKRLLPERKHRPLLKSLSDEALLTFLQQKIAERKVFYEKAKFIVTGDPVTKNDFLFIEQLLDKKIL